MISLHVWYVHYTKYILTFRQTADIDFNTIQTLDTHSPMHLWSKGSLTENRPASSKFMLLLLLLHHQFSDSFVPYSYTLNDLLTCTSSFSFLSLSLSLLSAYDGYIREVVVVLVVEVLRRRWPLLIFQGFSITPRRSIALVTLRTQK